MNDTEDKFKITFPTKRTFPIIETMMMRLIIERTLSVHVLSPLIIWYGVSRIGKTTTAQLMVDKIAEIYDPDDPNAFRAVHYEVGKIEENVGNDSKRGIKSLYNAVMDTPLDEAVYVRDPPEVLAKRLVHGAKLRNIQMVFIDEAGLLSFDAIRGMVLVRDVAENLGWTFTIVFIGMDDLPIKVAREPQVVNRIHEWCLFKEYGFDNTWEMLSELHPHFASLDKNQKEHIEQVEFVHSRHRGLPGLIIPYLQRLDHHLSINKLRANGYKGEINLTVLRSVYLMTSRDKDESIAQAEQKHRGTSIRTGRKRTVAGVKTE